MYSKYFNRPTLFDPFDKYKKLFQTKCSPRTIPVQLYSIRFQSRTEFIGLREFKTERKSENIQLNQQLCYKLL